MPPRLSARHPALFFHVAPMRISPDVVFRVLGEAAVLVDLSTNAIFELNDTGAAIWQRLSDGQPPDVIAGALAAEFDVTVATAREQCHDLMLDLQQRGLLIP
jgi:hypothetical protein